MERSTGAVRSPRSAAHPASQTVDTIVVGAGQAGLAMSHELTAQGRDHVVLDRGRVAERWLSQRWDSLHLLSPTWLNALPGHEYTDDDPDGYLSGRTFAAELRRYATGFGAPVVEDAPVTAATPDERGGWLVHTPGSSWRAASLVVATGRADVPHVPAAAAGLDPDIVQLTSAQYRKPGALPPGAVLVVGASASGVQIADEVRRSGRRVVLAVGSHSRMPRTYRGMDIMWWLASLGMLDRSVDAIADPAAHTEPSLQLIGRGRNVTLDLPALAGRGVELVGRLQSLQGTRAGFAADLPRTAAAAQERLTRIIQRVEDLVRDRRLAAELLPADPPAAFTPGPARTGIDLAQEGIGTVIWATGYRRDHSWLPGAALAGGEIRQRAGIAGLRGLYTVGMHFQSRRDSSTIGGVGLDAAAVAAHIGALRPRRRAHSMTRSLR